MDPHWCTRHISVDEPSARANAVAVDWEGAAYITGSTNVSYGGPDVFVTKLTPEGSALAYSRRFGGSNHDVAYGIAVDPQGYASVDRRNRFA